MRDEPDAPANAWALREGSASGRKFDLETRLLEFASAVIDLSEKLPATRAANHVAAQLLRSGTAPYPNHAEAESAESPEDFVHKLKLCLKELRETRRWARLIQRQGWAAESATLPFVLAESEELIRIFVVSIRTARQNALARKRPTPPSSVDSTRTVA
ncbi:MAG: four helix bundle protein [Verrucomicrobiae bacterium]|nr:four helix bundle protein [Verrucomicrobiae bacterium]